MKKLLDWFVNVMMRAPIDRVDMNELATLNTNRFNEHDLMRVFRGMSFKWARRLSRIAVRRAEFEAFTEDSQTFYRLAK